MMSTKPGNERPEERLVEAVSWMGAPTPDILPIARAMAGGIEALRLLVQYPNVYYQAGRRAEGEGTVLDGMAVARHVADIARTALQALDSLGEEG